MKRKDFLSGLGVVGIGSMLPLDKTSAAVNKLNGQLSADSTCTLIPSETAGPFPLDLTTNNFYFRQDVRETKTGVQLNLKLKIIGVGNCLPMQNLRVNIWHCDKDGLYSGYSQTGNAGQAGLTYLRGYQITNSDGEVEFITILPGWCTGRTCHIHFQVYVSSSYAAISQLTFDVATKNAIYAANPSLYTHGADPINPSSDGIFSDGYAYQLGTLTPNAVTGGYDSYLEVAIQGTGTLGVGYLEKENAKQFSLGQNFPNPYADETTIPLYLKNPSDVVLDLWDLMGRKAATITQNGLVSGNHEIKVNMNSLGLATGNYVYQLEVRNSHGTFRECKMMSALK